MLHAIEMETVIPQDGRLPDAFREAFGRKARVIVLLPDQPEPLPMQKTQSHKWMELAGKIDAFKAIEDPVAWQREQRGEWDREPDR